MKFITSLLTVCFLCILSILIVGAVFACDHEAVENHFSFQPQKSTADSWSKLICRDCHQSMATYKSFRGTPNDTSYLEAIKVHGKASEILPGEYYTITATVTLADYNFDKTVIRCKVQSDNIIVNFSVEFRGEFEEAVGLLEEGDEVTFRGRFYDKGCGFTDSELITK